MTAFTLVFSANNFSIVKGVKEFIQEMRGNCFFLFPSVYPGQARRKFNRELHTYFLFLILLTCK